MMNASDVAGIVWAETKELQPDVGEAGVRLDVLREMLARLVVSRGGVGFSRSEKLPDPADPVLGGAAASILEMTTRIAKEVEQGAKQPALILWPSTDPTRPLGPPTPPPDWAGPATLIGRFKAGGHVVYAFSRETTDANEKPFVSAVTGTGTVENRPLLAAGTTVVSEGKMRVAFWLAMAAVVVFIAACVWALSIGVAARSNQAVFQAVMAEKKTNAQFKDTTCSVTSTVDDLATIPPDWRRPPAVTDPAKAAEANRPEQLPNRVDCRGMWAHALQLVLKDESADWITQMFHRLTAGLASTPMSGQVSIRIPMMIMMVSLILLIMSAGLGVVGRPFGIFIDNRNRMSLTRVQLAVWTVILLGGLTTIGLFNVGFGTTLYRDLSQLGAIVGASDVDSVLGKVFERFAIFPKMDWPFLALLGITTTVTPVASYMLVGNKTGALSTEEAKKITAPADEANPLLRNESPDQAALKDLVTGERAKDAGVVDTTRVQHVAMSGLLAMTYASMLLETATKIDAIRVIRAVEKGANVFTSLPPIDSTFMTLLVITHGALLAGKWVDAQQAKK